MRRRRAVRTYPATRRGHFAVAELTVRAALGDAEDDSEPPEYADPVEFVEPVYDLDPHRFDDEIALRDAIAERRGTERTQLARQRYKQNQRDAEEAELRASLAD